MIEQVRFQLGKVKFLELIRNFEKKIDYDFL